MKKKVLLVTFLLLCTTFKACDLTASSAYKGSVIAASPNFSLHTSFPSVESIESAIQQEKSDVRESTEVSAKRITYKENFYYEPLSESTKAYINGKSYKEDCTLPYEALRFVHVQFYNFEQEIEDGEIICNAAIAQDLVEIFYQLYLSQYPIESIQLVDAYNADDEMSMEANNTSCFNYRTIGGKKTLSKHALGLAIDINPFYNPYVTHKANATFVSPSGSEFYADRSIDFPYKITHDDLCYRLFTEHGFDWGGDWKNTKDYQHFEKNL